MRCSPPRPSTSCIGWIAVSATAGAGGCGSGPSASRGRRSPGSRAAWWRSRSRGAGPPADAWCRCRACRCRPPCRARGCAAGSGCSAVAAEGELQDAHAREARSACAAPSTSGVITPRSSAMIGSGPSAVGDGLEQRGARARRRQRPLIGGRLAGRDLPVAGEAAEVVDAHDVDQSRRCAACARSTRRSPRRACASQRYSGLPQRWPVALK